MVSFLEDFQFAEAGTIGGFYGGIDDEETYFNFTNYITPSKIYKLNLNTMEYALFLKKN